MKGISKNKRGISLIVLVITIIVMIILASAIILSLRSSGIIGRANKAVTDSDIANAKNVVSLAFAEWELDNETLSDRYATFSEYAMVKLEEAGFDDSYMVKEDGTLVTGALAVILNNNVSLGATINYDEFLSNNKSVTDGSERDGEFFNSMTTIKGTSQTVETARGLTWRYIGLDDKGNILIAPDIPSVMEEKTKLNLSFDGGYRKGVNTLNTVCGELYSTSLGTARSMNIDDIINILEYTGPKGSYNVNGMVYTNEPLTGEQILNTGVIDRLDQFYKEQLSDYYDISSESTLINSKGSLVFLVGEYWLANKADQLVYEFGYCDGYIRCVSSSLVSGKLFYNSDYMSNEDYSYTLAIRPVVTLNSNLKLSYNSSSNSLTIS